MNLTDENRTIIRSIISAVALHAVIQKYHASSVEQSVDMSIKYADLMIKKLSL